jgi:ElaB/YqjD/DUF883 family membrane-anchored ribosome-binding protein
MFNFPIAAVESLGTTAATDAPELGVAAGEEVMSIEEAAFGLLDAEEDIVSVESMMGEIDRMESYVGLMLEDGLTAKSLKAMDYDGLLSSTCMVIPAAESIYTDLAPEDDQVTVSVEGLMENVKAKVGEWATAAMNAVNKIGEKITGYAKSFFSKVTEWWDWAKNKTIDATKAAKEKIKAHPYAAAAAAVGVALALAAVIAVIWGPGLAAIAAAPGKWMASVSAIFKKEATNIGGKTLSASGTGTAVVAQGSAKTITESTFTQLGWTQAKLKSLVDTIVGAFRSGGGAISKGFASLRNYASSAIKQLTGKGAAAAAGSTTGTAVVAQGSAKTIAESTFKHKGAVASAAGKVGEAAMIGANGLRRAFMGCIRLTWAYIKFMFAGLGMVVLETFRAMRGVFTGGAAATTGRAVAAV